MKLIKGKKVRIIESSEFWKTTKESQSVNNSMCEHCGKIATITKARGDACHLNIDKMGFWWKKEYLIDCVPRKQKKISKPKIKKVWVAMDESTKVYLYKTKPTLDKDQGMFLDHNKGYAYLDEKMVKGLFPNLTFKNSPKKVKLSIELITE